MAIDPSNFLLLNVVDTCSVWNVLSSKSLFQASLASGCNYCCTAFVEYECLTRPRTTLLPEDEELKKRLREARGLGQFKVYHLELEELNEVEVLENRKRLGRGELSSIAFANRTDQAFMTDDQRARRLAVEVMASNRVQTTPQLLGWLVFCGRIMDADVSGIVADHVSLDRPLKVYFEEMCQRGLEYRLRAGTGEKK